MLVELWPIDRPKDYPKNARKWSVHAVEKVAASIREYGWRQPVVVDANDVIVIGHLEAAGFEVRCQIIWAKNTFAWGFG